MKVYDLIKKLEYYMEELGNDCEVNIMVDSEYSNMLGVRKLQTTDKPEIVIYEKDLISEL